MKITELRKMLESTDTATLKKTVVEVYKLLPTNKKLDADDVIASVLSGDGKKVIKVEEKVDYRKLFNEVNRFLENAYNQCYYVPNRVVQKKDRPKWRFLVKRYVKDLEKVPTDSDFYNESVELLIKLYEMMCYACRYYLFSSTDSFQSVGISQSSFYDLIVEKTFAKVFVTEDDIATLIICATTGGLSTWSLHINQVSILLSYLNTEKYLRMAIDKAKEFVETNGDKLKKLDRYSNTVYCLEDAINQLCNFILMAEIKLDEFDDGVKYYLNNAKENDNEIILYCALDTIKFFTDDDDLWVRCYEYGIKYKKIKPRDELKEAYEKILNKKK
ncbi:MAG: hypothetical protein MR457_01450 [Solobacterium sp.]|nr:hypothetical protein [Solobacterium sp.]